MVTSHSHRSSRSARALLVLLAAAIAACGDDDGAAGGGTADGTGTTAAAAPAADVTVMTRNLYLGADLAPLLAATPEDLGAVAAATYQQVLESDIPARLALVAGELASTRPDLVALQEATVWTEQAAGAAEATIRFDFVQLLVEELVDRGVPYRVAVIADGFHGELPVEGVGLVSLQDRDAILVRDGSAVAVSNGRSGEFSAALELSVAGVPLRIQRGWAAVDATAGGRSFVVVATHLEAFDDVVRDQQQAELVDTVGGFARSALVLGDLNSAAGGSDPEAYEAMGAAGFVDAWREFRADEPGPTCCWSAGLTGGVLDERIDFVLLRGGIYVQSIDVVGDDASSQTPSGRFASDHAGVVAALTVNS